ncbi:hypothetical protein YZ36_00045 [Campylobacter lari]|uniref:SIR2-like domain-containing protein n=1 Tax=Campylobacter lari TaxID=201 RepID=A0A825SD83_CAMLA|nr:hypothetical protein [Campylobacter lari]
MQNKNDVFFFGAGFSKSLNNSYPTLAELSKYFIEQGHIYNNEKIYQENIEQLLTYLIAPLPFKTKEEILRDEASYLEKINIINSFFINLHNVKSIDINNEDIKILSKFINQNKSTCITLNYDLLLEQILSKNTLYECFYKFPINSLSSRGRELHHRVFTPLKDDLFKQHTPEIIKLHGSINWYHNRSISNSQIYIYDNQHAPEYYLDMLKIDMHPLIIPPILDKTSNYNHTIMQALWMKAFNAIIKAKNIYIYGFSFLLSDLSIVYLFQKALQLNKNNYTIYVINTNRNLSSKKKRYIDIFGENKCNFEFCCENNFKKFMKYLSCYIKEDPDDEIEKLLKS